MTTHPDRPGRKVAIWGAATMVCLAPALVGGGPPWAQVALSTAALAVVAAWVIVTPKPHLGTFGVVALVAVAATVVQLVPLPAVLVRWISPQAAALREAVASAPPRFMPLTVDVPATLIELGNGLACLGLLCLAAAASRGRRPMPILVALAAIGPAIAAIALVERLCHSSRILGLYTVQDLPGGGIFGTFVNGNQASSLLGLSCLVAAGLAIEAEGTARGLLVTSSAISALGVLTTASRSGAVALVIGGFLFVAVRLVARFGRARGLGVSLLILVLTAAAVLWGADDLRERILPTDLSVLWNNQKTRGWLAALRLIGAFPWTGVGRGAFEGPATAFRLDHESVRLEFPENIVLQTAADWGGPIALLLFAAFVVRCGPVARRLSRLPPATQATAFGVLACLVHDLGDFALQLPGVAMPAAIALSTVGMRADDGSAEASQARRRWVLPVLALWGAALVGAWWAVPRLHDAEDRRLAAALSQRPPAHEGAAQLADDIGAAARRHPADYYLALIAAYHDLGRGRPPGPQINRALTLYPADPVAHRVAGDWLARSGHRSQAALEYRLSYEHGMLVPYQDLLSALGPEYLPDAVPQKQFALLDVVRFLLRTGNPAAAGPTSERLLQIAPDREAALLALTEVGLFAGSAPGMAQFARRLFEVASTPESLQMAVRALVTAHEPKEADRALMAVLARRPGQPWLVLFAARTRLDLGNPMGARDLIRQHRDHFDTRDQMAGEEILAAAAERLGDAESAAAAHARAEILRHLGSR